MFCLVILVSNAFSFMLANHLSVSVSLNVLFTLTDHQTFVFVFAAVILNITFYYTVILNINFYAS